MVKIHHQLPAKLWRLLVVKRKLVVVGIVSAFVLLNVGLFVRYHDRTYPGALVSGKALGSISYAQLPERIDRARLLPDTVELKLKDKASTVSPTDLGVAIDSAQLAAQIKQKRSWLPVVNLVRRPTVSLKLKIDDPRFDEQVAKITDTQKLDPVDARITLENGRFTLHPETDGYKPAAQAVKASVLDSLSKGDTTIALPTETTQPQHKQSDLQSSLQSLQTQQDTPVTFTYQDKTKKLTPAELAEWFAPSDASFILDDAKIKASVVAIGASFGIKVQNLNAAVASAKSAVQNTKPLNFALEPMPPQHKTYTYCTALRGVDASHMGGLQAKLVSTYADVRGWSLGGQVTFTRADSGCSFTVWLTAADQMSTFGSICDADWSCRVGANVVINFDRWQGASSAWNQAGGSLDDYRSMVINHETGHWFGFDHASCGGAGQAAPVMQQQSISLGGCKFNPWPLPSELVSLRVSLSL